MVFTSSVRPLYIFSPSPPRHLCTVLIRPVRPLSNHFSDHCEADSASLWDNGIIRRRKESMHFGLHGETLKRCRPVRLKNYPDSATPSPRVGVNWPIVCQKAFTRHLKVTAALSLSDYTLPPIGGRLPASLG